MCSYKDEISHHDMVASKSYIENLRKHQETVKKRQTFTTFNTDICMLKNAEAKKVISCG